MDDLIFWWAAIVFRFWTYSDSNFAGQMVWNPFAFLLVIAHQQGLIYYSLGCPGCSSLEGLLQENGVSRYNPQGAIKQLLMTVGPQPFSWIVGTAKPIVNQYSWTNLSSMLYVEQPVGTGMPCQSMLRTDLVLMVFPGFSLGTPNAKVKSELVVIPQSWTGYEYDFSRTKTM